MKKEQRKTKAERLAIMAYEELRRGGALEDIIPRIQASAPVFVATEDGLAAVGAALVAMMQAAAIPPELEALVAPVEAVRNAMEKDGWPSEFDRNVK